MIPYRSQWIRMAHYGSIWLHMSPNDFLLSMAPYDAIWLLTDLVGSLWLPMAFHSHDSLRLSLIPFGSL